MKIFYKSAEIRAEGFVERLQGSGLDNLQINKVLSAMGILWDLLEV